jgi:hypothetical protein
MPKEEAYKCKASPPIVLFGENHDYHRGALEGDEKSNQCM